MKNRVNFIVFLILLVFFLIQKASAIEVLKKGHYIKGFYTHFSSTFFFNSDREKVSFGFGGEGLFRTMNLEYRYGITDRLNSGFFLPWTFNVFDNDFGELERNSITDLSIIAEYRFLNFPKILALRGGLKIPLGYDSDPQQLYLGNGTTDIFAGITFKHFFKTPHTRKFDNLWFEIDVALSVPINDDPGNIDGDFSVPWRAGISYRPIHDLTLAAGMVSSINDQRDFIAYEGIVKYRLTYAFELEGGITHIFAGNNSSSGSNIFLGFSVNTNRLWD